MVEGNKYHKCNIAPIKECGISGRAHNYISSCNHLSDVGVTTMFSKEGHLVMVLYTEMVASLMCNVLI